MEFYIYVKCQITFNPCEKQMYDEKIYKKAYV